MTIPNSPAIQSPSTYKHRSLLNIAKSKAKNSGGNMKKLIQIITLTLILLTLAGCGQKKVTWEVDNDSAKTTVTTYLKRESNIDYVENVEIILKSYDSDGFESIEKDLKTESGKQEFADQLSTEYGYIYDKDLKVKIKKDEMYIKTKNGYIHPELLNDLGVTYGLSEPITLTSFQEALHEDFKRID